MNLKAIKIWLLVGLLWGMPALCSADVVMNYKDVDIRAFIDSVAIFSGKNFLIDSRVHGKVTIVSTGSIPEAEAYNVFLSVLEVNGFAAVESGAVIKIIPRAESKHRAIPVQSEGLDNDAMVTQVLALKYADSQQLVALIRPLISANSHLVAYTLGNMLLITDSASNIKRIKGIIRLLDRKDTVGVHLFKLKHASADKLAGTLGRLYPSAPNSPNSLKAISQQPGNILMVVASPQKINEVSSLINKLDAAPIAEGGRLKVRYLKYAKAKIIENVLTRLMSAKAGSGKPLFANDVRVIAEETTNSLLITADPSNLTSINAIIDKRTYKRLAAVFLPMRLYPTL